MHAVVVWGKAGDTCSTLPTCCEDNNSTLAWGLKVNDPGCILAKFCEYLPKDVSGNWYMICTDSFSPWWHNSLQWNANTYRASNSSGTMSEFRRWSCSPASPLVWQAQASLKRTSTPLQGTQTALAPSVMQNIKKKKTRSGRCKS